MKQNLATFLKRYPSILITIGGLLITSGILMLARDQAFGYLALVLGMGVLLVNILAAQSDKADK
jgi:hypothetical protein